MKVFTLANVYCPNKNPIEYLSLVLNKLMDFRAGEVILAGDLNFCIDPTLDSTSSLQGVSRKHLKNNRTEIARLPNDRCMESPACEG